MGAFEDRLASGYRDAAKGGTEMSKPSSTKPSSTERLAAAKPHPTDRLAVAVTEGLMSAHASGVRSVAAPGLTEYIVRAIAADPTLICPDPADHLALQEARDGFVALQEHVRAVRCPDPADHALADAIRDAVIRMRLAVIRKQVRGWSDETWLNWFEATIKTLEDKP